MRMHIYMFSRVNTFDQGKSIGQFRERWLLPLLQEDPETPAAELHFPGAARIAIKHVSFNMPATPDATPMKPLALVGASPLRPVPEVAVQADHRSTDVWTR